MAAVAWIGIEQAAPQPARPVEPGATGASAVRPRLRRHQRRVLGPFDLASTAFQRNAREVLLGSAVFIVPAVAINLLVSNIVFANFTGFDEVAVSVPEFIGGVEAATGVETVLGFLAIVINSLAVAMTGGYVTGVVLRSSLGLEVTVGSVLRGMAGRLPSITVAWLIGHSWMVLGSVALVRLSSVDLAPLAVVLVPFVAWIVGLTLFASPVIVAERRGPLAGLRRAAGLVRKQWGVAIGFVGLCALIGGGLRLLIGSLPQLIEATGLLTFGRFGGVAEGVASQLSQLMIVPLVGMATAQCYLQMRMDREGMDLIVEADVVFAG